MIFSSPVRWCSSGCFWWFVLLGSVFFADVVYNFDLVFCYYLPRHRCLHEN